MRNFDFCGKWKQIFAVPVILIVLGIVLFFTVGLNIGVDFSGGSLIYAEIGSGKFEVDDIYNPLIRMEDQRFAATAEAFGTKYGDGYINVYQPTTYVSYYSSCEKFIFQYMTLYVPGMTPGVNIPTSDNLIGTFVNAVEWISEDEAEKLKREGY